MDLPQEDFVKTGDIPQGDQIDENSYRSEALSQALNYNSLSPPREHLMYSAWAEIGLFDLYDEESSNLNHCNAPAVRETADPTKGPIEKEDEIMATEAEKIIESISYNTFMEAEGLTTDKPIIQTNKKDENSNAEKEREEDQDEIRAFPSEAVLTNKQNETVQNTEKRKPLNSQTQKSQLL